MITLCMNIQIQKKFSDEIIRKIYGTVLNFFIIIVRLTYMRHFNTFLSQS